MVKTRRAGKRIGEGKFGFAIQPPIPCEGEKGPRDGFATRLPRYPEGISPDEWKLAPSILAKLREIDPEQKYFYYPVECTPGTLTAENKADGATEELKPYAELIPYAPNGTWSDPKYRPRKMWELGRKELVLESTASRTKEQEEHLIKAVVLLHKNGMTHGDIHPSNVVIATDGLPRLIDFEMAKLDGDPRLRQQDMEALNSVLKGERVLTSMPKNGGAGEKVAYTVGRFQPPTIGHRMLIQAVIDAAGPKGLAYVFVSSTVGKGKDAWRSPLTSAQKLPLLENMFPSGVTFVDTATCDKPCGGPGYALAWLLEKGYDPTDISFVVGAERLDHTTKVKGVYFGPDADLWGSEDKPRPANFVAVGHNPDRKMAAPSNDADNMSGTKARGYIKDGRLPDFYTAIGVDYPRASPELKAAVDSVIKTIRETPKPGGGADGPPEVIPTQGPDGEPATGGRRRTRRVKRNKASGKALYRRGSRSRNGSSKTNRSSYGSRGY